jgi:EAL domain-containing protein (putative c-di-GMP-specific phosphodiesterase class I)/PAS domain-containing protein
MDDALRVLILEHRDSQTRIGQQLLADYNLDFRWQPAASVRELRQIAGEFDPSIVLCTSDLAKTSGRGLLDVLRLLCALAPDILVSGLGGGASPDPGLAFTHACAERDESAAYPDTEYASGLEQSFSSILESSSSPMVICDGDGWITHANTAACTELHASTALLGTDLDARRIAHFDLWSGRPTPLHMSQLLRGSRGRTADGATAMALVARRVDSARIPLAARFGARGDDGTAAAGRNSSRDLIRYGSILRLSRNRYLAALPPRCSSAEAVSTAQAVIDSIADAPQVVDRPRAPRPTAVQRTSNLELDLGDALRRQTLTLQYQPQYDLKTGGGCGVEALVRWVLASGENVAPSVFIPIAERAGLIRELGAWVLKSACETAKGWCRASHSATLSVNVSALQIDEEFCALLGRILKQSGFPPGQLELEITESALVPYTDRTVECMKQWKQLGVRIAVDDFGTGYSNLNYLSRLPLDRLKLDQSLVHRMTADEKGAEVMRWILSLGAQLGIDVMAEGVETEQQLQMLTDLGCPQAQGYLFSRPMSGSQAPIVLRKTWGNRLRQPCRSIDATRGQAHVH